MSPDNTDTRSADLRRRLKDRRQQLRGEIREALLRADADRFGVIAGQLAESQEQSMVDLLAEVRHADVARDVEAALARLDADTYGHCVGCGAAIAPLRLDAYPTAKRCLPCQQRHEAARARQ